MATCQMRRLQHLCIYSTRLRHLGSITQRHGVAHLQVEHWCMLLVRREPYTVTYVFGERSRICSIMTRITHSRRADPNPRVCSAFII